MIILILSTTTQLDLFAGIENKQFPFYHLENPHIYAKFKEITLGAIQRGFTHWSSKGVFEILRYETAVFAKDGQYKVNNTYTPFYSRMFTNEFPNHKDFFERRKSKFDKLKTA